MNVYGESFIFDTFDSKEYNLAMCSMDSADTKKESLFSWTISKGEINPYRHKPNYYHIKPTDVLSFDITVIKCDGTSFSPDERMVIIRKMTSPLSHSVLQIKDFSDGYQYHADIYFRAIVIGYSEIVPVGDISGMTFSFECDSPYGYIDYEETFINESDADIFSFNIENESDDLYLDYYPTFKVKAVNTGTITITNLNYPDEIMRLKMYNGQELHIDCAQGDIQDLNVGLFDYETDTNLVWIRLSHGLNQIEVSGLDEITVSCAFNRKVGI